MNHADKNRNELRSLLDELCNGTLSPSNHAELQHLLKSDAAAREEYLDYIELHIDLKRITSPVGDIPADSTKLLERILERPIPNEVQLAPDIASPRWRLQTILPWVMLATVAAGLLLMVRPYWVDKPGRIESADNTSPFESNAKTPENGIEKQVSRVRLTQIASAKFFGEAIPPLQGIVPFGHEYALSEGMVALQFPAGANAIIEAPAIFVVSDDARLLMKTGVCSVHAPDGAQGFRVDTPMANVVDLGTRFVLSVAQTGETKVQVVEGEAEVFTNSLVPNPNVVASAAIRLYEHQARVIESNDRVTTKEIPFKASDYKPSLPDRIIRFEAVEDDRGAVDELVAVSVQRNAVEYQYSVDQMIGIDLIHFHGVSNAFLVTSSKVEDPSQPDVQGPSRARFLDRDRSLCSGLINPGGQAVALTSDPVLDDPNLPERIGTPGIGLRFKTPVMNGPGPDIVLFELQTIVNSERGDAFHVSPLHFDTGLHSHTIRRYDINLTSPQSKMLAPYRLYRAREVPLSFLQSLQTAHFGGPIHGIAAKVLAVGIDLSDLGFPIGAKVEGLFLQDAADDNDSFDPVFIAGLPPTP